MKRIITVIAVLLISVFLSSESIIFTSPEGKRFELEVPETYEELKEYYTEIAELYLEERWSHEKTIKDLDDAIELYNGLKESYERIVEKYDHEIDLIESKVTIPLGFYLYAGAGYPLSGNVGFQLMFYEQFFIAVTAGFPLTANLWVGIGLK